MAAPDIEAARRAADELVRAGAGRVLLFGSVARGEATDRSDIDLVAIYDDLDYKVRSKRRCALEAQAGAVAGCPVDVVVTDAPEWQVRTTRVPCSVEARIAGYAVELADTGRHAGIDWNKEIGLPSNPTAELASRFGEIYNAALRLENHLRPTVAEIRDADAGNTASQHHKEGVRFASAMSEVLAIVESAAKATHIASVGTAPAWKHNIPALLKNQPEPIRNAFFALAGSTLDLTVLDEWRKSNYLENRPDLPTEDDLREQCTVALHIAAIAVDQCRLQGIPEQDLALWDEQVSLVSDLLDGPLRYRDTPDIGIEL
ncbi:nucleotidyltransferase domain-containing protein [Candidatus Poriferisodalis sp.]|uniref:nucleotidyltransferase domain-containing protein n=1 Tax=Candidatus Poriferisodalis sp. TaxID=3101277 RepID=UPI003B01DC1D